MRYGALTDVGRVRRSNEDEYLVRPPLFAVADGMGGHSAGEVASRLALQTISKQAGRNLRYLAGCGPRERFDLLNRAFSKANDIIHSKAVAETGAFGMGTTLTALLVSGATATLAHVGDSRAYLFRGGLSQLTQDHSLVADMVRAGQLRPEEAAAHPKRNVITRALGAEPAVDVDIAEHEIEDGDRFLLCSDGLTSLVPDTQIAAVLENRGDPQQACAELVELANKAGGNDNITVIVLDPTAPDDDIARRDARSATRGAGTRLSLWWLLPVILVPLMATALLTGARWYLANSYYFDFHGDRVALYRGIHTSFAGYPLYRLEFDTAIRADQLPGYYRERIEGGLPVSDPGAASRQIQYMQELADKERGRR